jgi:hypothetical protein
MTCCRRYEQIQLIGYVEKDGNIGITQENERVIIGSTIEEGIVVFVVVCSSSIYRF